MLIKQIPDAYLYKSICAHTTIPGCNQELDLPLPHVPSYSLDTEMIVNGDLSMRLVTLFPEVQWAGKAVAQTQKLFGLPGPLTQGSFSVPFLLIFLTP